MSVGNVAYGGTEGEFTEEYLKENDVTNFNFKDACFDNDLNDKYNE
eukprot:CAMPEP_0116873102 /NCGR_PEP_ID=MMETSP0463-20121206/4077_1 /TAXON_ID=181622 /ORGANISM="Strombidinopsis sp, Strain SopsisLIS2011" /LENGTH=45 /DNA_ID= /DNA_START= /DNA_END= /DNA_ORIENTATION=